MTTMPDRPLVRAKSTNPEPRQSESLNLGLARAWLMNGNTAKVASALDERDRYKAALERIHASRAEAFDRGHSSEVARIVREALARG